MMQDRCKPRIVRISLAHAITAKLPASVFAWSMLVICQCLVYLCDRLTEIGGSQ